jgi:hypothetical protein
LSTDSLGFSRRVAVLLIKQCDILLVKPVGYMASYDRLLGEHMFSTAVLHSGRGTSRRTTSSRGTVLLTRLRSLRP